jgi:hypothetical protein
MEDWSKVFIINRCRHPYKQRSFEPRWPAGGDAIGYGSDHLAEEALGAKENADEGSRRGIAVLP